MKTITCVKCGHENKVSAAPVPVHVTELRQSDIGSLITVNRRTELLTSFDLSPKGARDDVIAFVCTFDRMADRMHEPDSTQFYIRESNSTVIIWR